MYRVEENWRSLIACLTEECGKSLVYLLGRVDTGKTTLCRFLVEEMSTSKKTAHIDCDPGQTVVGPPATVGLAIYPRPEHDRVILRFVGSTTPQGHLLQMVTGGKRLAQKGFELGAERVVCDSPGFVAGDAAREFQYQMIDLLQPDHLIALQERDELESLLAVFGRRKTQIHRLPVSQAVVKRMPEVRRRYREERFRNYFEPAKPVRLPLGSIGLHGRIPDLRHSQGCRNNLIALCDEEGFVLVLGVLERIDVGADCLQLHAPPFDVERVASVQLGSICLDPFGHRKEE